MKIFGLNDKQKKALEKLERRAARESGFSSYAKNKLERIAQARAKKEVKEDEQAD